MAYSTKVKRARESAELSQEEFGRLAGVHPNTISSIETGVSNPRKETRKKIDSIIRYLKKNEKSESPIRKSYPEWLKQARIDAGISQREVAEKCNVHPTTISGYEKDKCSATAAMIKRISHVIKNASKSYSLIDTPIKTPFQQFEKQYETIGKMQEQLKQQHKELIAAIAKLGEIARKITL